MQIENLKKALANKEAQSVQLSKTCENPRTLLERTPPRPRRLSIENCANAKSDKSMNIEDKKGGFKTPSLQNRSRRLSLEGPRSAKKDNHQINVSEDVGRPEMVLMQKYGNGQTQDEEAVTKQFGQLDTRGSLLAKAPPRSPRSANYYQKRVTKTDTRTQIPSLQVLKTPESQMRNKREVEMKQQLTLSIDNLTPNMVNSTNGKGSHIRRSLRTTIGKLINGSEKRFMILISILN